MKRSDRFREVLTGPLTHEFVESRQREGWEPYAVEWVRAASKDEPQQVETPYGLRVAGDGRHLEEDPSETDVMMAVLEGLVQDWSLSRITADLDRRGYTMRTGTAWTPGAVFDLLPRLIEVSRTLFARPEWHERRRVVLQR